MLHERMLAVVVHLILKTLCSLLVVGVHLILVQIKF